MYSGYFTTSNFICYIFWLMWAFLWLFLQALAIGVVQLFVTDPPDHSTWRRSDAGVLCLVKDNQQRSYFFRLYCLSRCEMVWEHEVYNSMVYKCPKLWLHTFEGEVCDQCGLALYLNWKNMNSLDFVIYCCRYGSWRSEMQRSVIAFSKPVQ